MRVVMHLTLPNHDIVSTNAHTFLSDAMPNTGSHIKANYISCAVLPWHRVLIEDGVIDAKSSHNKI